MVFGGVIALGLSGPVYAGSGIGLNPAGFITFNMPLGGAGEQSEMNVRLEFKNGHTSIMSFGLNGDEGDGAMTVGNGRPSDWREDYQSLQDEPYGGRTHVRNGQNTQRVRARQADGQSESSPRSRYMSLLSRYQAASPAQQRTLYGELQEAYRAATAP